MVLTPSGAQPGERLQRYLARAGVASRRACEGVIRAGRVTVDGTTVTDPARAVRPGQVVAVDGRPVAPPAPVVLAVHKPAGYVSTVRDPRGRPTVVALVPDRWGRLYPVGRLDADSEGLLLLTNDGDLTFLLTHPRHAVPRVYRVQVRPAPEPGQLRRLAEGVLLADGPTRPAAVRREGADWLRLTLREGRNRQVRRMCAAVGLEVLRLQRVAIGPVRLDGLRPGAWRRLAAGEVAALREAAAPRGGRGQETGPARRKAAPSRDRGGQARR